MCFDMPDTTTCHTLQRAQVSYKGQSNSGVTRVSYLLQSSKAHRPVKTEQWTVAALCLYVLAVYVWSSTVYLSTCLRSTCLSCAEYLSLSLSRSFLFSESQSPVSPLSLQRVVVHKGESGGFYMLLIFFHFHPARCQHLFL